MRFKCYLFCFKWLFQNRNWKNTRQKRKAMERDWNKYKAKIVR